MQDRYFSPARRAPFFDLVVAGVPIYKAGPMIGASRQSGQTWWTQSASMIPLLTGNRRTRLAPAADHWIGRGLSSIERGQIQAGLHQGMTQAQIARMTGRSPSTISREITRNSGPDGSYYAALAHAQAWQRARRPKPYKLTRNPGLCQQITQWMNDGWSPGLIAKLLAADPAIDHADRVSAETIYQALYVQTRGHLRADLHQQLSLRRAQRRSATTPRRGGGSPFTTAYKISERPAEVADRAVPGHWEGDLIVGPNNSAIGTLVERATRFTILLHLPAHRHDSISVATAMIREMSHLPAHLRRSITWDRGVELAEYRSIQFELDTTVYFCDPRSPWQRGTNENTNRLLRHWFTKGSDLSVHTADDLRRVQDLLNKRPRPTLDLKTPAQALHQLLHPKPTTADCTDH